MAGRRVRGPAHVILHRAAGGWDATLPRQWRPRTARPAALAGVPYRIRWRSDSATGQVTAQGGAVLIMAPHGGVTWFPHEAIVWCSTNPQYQVFAQVYQGGANGFPTSLLASSFTGSGDTMGLPGRAIVPGDALILVVSQGQPGALVTVRYEGMQDVLT